MKVDLVRLILRILTFGFIVGKIKKKESGNGRLRGFVDAVFPLPANHWQKGVDFLWEPKKLVPETRKGDRVIFFGYRSPSGWKAKWVLKLF